MMAEQTSLVESCTGRLYRYTDHKSWIFRSFKKRSRTFTRYIIVVKALARMLDNSTVKLSLCVGNSSTHPIPCPRLAVQITESLPRQLHRLFCEIRAPFRAYAVNLPTVFSPYAKTAAARQNTRQQPNTARQAKKHTLSNSALLCVTAISAEGDGESHTE